MIIKINCPQCKKEIKIDIKKIEKLEKEILHLKSIIKKLEVGNVFSDIFGGKR